MHGFEVRNPVVLNSQCLGGGTIDCGGTQTHTRSFSVCFCCTNAECNAAINASARPWGMLLGGKGLCLIVYYLRRTKVEVMSRSGFQLAVKAIQCPLLPQIPEWRHGDVCFVKSDFIFSYSNTFFIFFCYNSSYAYKFTFTYLNVIICLKMRECIPLIYVLRGHSC